MFAVDFQFGKVTFHTGCRVHVLRVLHMKMEMRLRRIAGITASSQQIPLFDPLPLCNLNGMLLEVCEDQIFEVVRLQNDRVPRRKEGVR